MEKERKRQDKLRLNNSRNRSLNASMKADLLGLQTPFIRTLMCSNSSQLTSPAKSGVMNKPITQGFPLVIVHSCTKVVVVPGAIVFTRMPNEERSLESVNVIPTIALLLAAYASCPICPSYAAILAVLMITPRSTLDSGRIFDMLLGQVNSNKGKLVFMTLTFAIPLTPLTVQLRGGLR
ncbi:hypothetical protein PsorP6_000508 [Peronosclerospora sorghi]|uniref:Uncharacterized protein n=1 Tax=Peronosclerospora sorghi TaxID=230839 RepID=A0ACC0WTD7_9STRA|nr:hypothetical protein PsorP6_000508 [Peronosclerospora sorghi]